MCPRSFVSHRRRRCPRPSPALLSFMSVHHVRVGRESHHQEHHRARKFDITMDISTSATISHFCMPAATRWSRCLRLASLRRPLIEFYLVRSPVVLSSSSYSFFHSLILLVSPMMAWFVDRDTICASAAPALLLSCRGAETQIDFISCKAVHR
jgi:hypothetical protein